MITQNEINSLSLSPTKKDFYQIWNELLDVAGKLSERWDPTSTNESDPGIVILKALTGIADKLNYNIDKNTLEAFMPTAAQDESMRKLCDMLGYNVKYYRSAETDVTIKYYNPDPSDEEAAVLDGTDLEGVLTIPKFTVITNADQDVNYFTTNQVPLYITSVNPTITVPCMEGQIVKCESINDNNVITINQISENNRFYLPETQIAENGIFIYNIFNYGENLTDGTVWEKVDNLNVQVRGSRVYKFGYDSYEGRPYVEFPEDYSELFNDGIFLYYTRTNGASGNISARTLSSVEIPTGGVWDKVAAESFSAENAFAATTGANIETIKQAYNNFKKTVGTFETLVTCRDYMNKIYTMTESGKPLVSNTLVTDIRSDLNRAVAICSCDDSGIFFRETSLKDDKISTLTTDQYTDYVRTDYKEGKFEKVGEATENGDCYDADPSTTIKETTGTNIVDTTIEYIATEGNKPFYSTTAATTSTFVLSAGQFVNRTTNWYIGSMEVPVFSDTWFSGLVSSADKFNFKGTQPADKDENGNYKVSAYNDNGERSNYWLITQGGKTYTTILPITWAENRTINQVTQVETITKTKIQEVIVTQQYERENIETQSRDYIKETVKTVEERVPAIDHFDLVLYPFKSYNQIISSVKDINKVYDASFEFSPSTFKKVRDRIEASNLKTISHNLVPPRAGDVISINNYLRLNATIATNAKVTSAEGDTIITKIKIALANAFNMRELDFGESIPFDSIIEVIEAADSRIRVASLNDPTLYTTYSVLEKYDEANGQYELREYAVASNWLTHDEAEKTKRFTYTEADGSTTSTFDVETAKKIYNKLAVRNVLAGRVPLFNYDNTFKTSFYEGSYQVKTPLMAKPEVLNENPSAIPTETNTFTIFADGDKIYTGEYDENDPENPKYTEISTPDSYKNGIIDLVDNNAITSFNTHCTINANDDNIISNVTLGPGEFIKFRAPNLRTLKTYPAYVNYHLALNTEFDSEASSAQAYTLFDLLDSDRADYTDEKTIRWQKVLDHFAAVDEREQRSEDNSYVKQFTLEQKVSAYTTTAATDASDLCSSPENTSGQHVRNESTGTCEYCGVKVFDTVQKGPIVIDVNTDVSGDSTQQADNYLFKSGCVKLKSFKPTLVWAPAEGETAPLDSAGPDLDIQVTFANNNPFITDTSIFSTIKESVNTALTDMLSKTNEDGTPILPACSWIIRFEFECVPFELNALNEWQKFIKLENKNNLFDFSAVIESENILWRAFGEGYQIGRGILPSTQKLLKFEGTHYSLLPETPLKGIYIVESLGKDAKPAVKYNNTEYKLQNNEYLYIEYTPSTTNEDGTTSESTAVTEVLGPGTIIKPSGFEVGLMDSSTYAALGNKSHKTVTFEVNGRPVALEMFRFGANEQVEVRELSKVSLKNDLGSSFYYYKNFNGCVLDDLYTTNKNREYTLKDGEYILYTDQNKSEFAYFTTGTKVSCNFLLDKFDIIDLTTIEDSGIQIVPWKFKSLAGDENIEFQEYQYITLGPDDTLKNLKLTSVEHQLNGEWQAISDSEYLLAGSETAATLPNIELENGSNSGWEAVSILELATSPNNSQILRNDGTVATGITITGIAPGGSGTSELPLIVPDESNTISFKTNLICQTSGNHIDIDDIYINPTEETGFKFKIFSADTPAIVETAPGKVIPTTESGITDITNWPGEPLTVKAISELWQAVNLDDIKPVSDSAGITKERALRLPVNISANTYGVFSIYLNYSEGNGKTYIEVLPGTNHDDVTILNTSQVNWENSDENSNNSDRLILQHGINCIRVNKSTKLFIKTAEGEYGGSLMFDDLKLVNCSPITLKYYNEGNSTLRTVDLGTQGLNIQQIGYLSTASADEVANTVKEEAEQGYVNETKQDLEVLENAKEREYTVGVDEIKELLPKINKLSDFVKQTGEELKVLKETITNTDSDLEDIKGLFAKYEEIANELEQEKALLSALENNKNIDYLEEQLVELLEHYDTLVYNKQQLFVELSELTAQAAEAIKQIPSIAVIADFKKLNLDDDTDSALLSELKEALLTACKASVESYYNSQLVPLHEKLNNISNMTEREQLISLLVSLREEHFAEELTNILANVRRIVNTETKNELDTYLENMINAAVNLNYSELYGILAELEKFLKEMDLNKALADLETALAESATSEHIETLLTAVKTHAANTTAISTEVSTKLTAVRTALGNNYASAETELPNVTTTTKALYDEINNEYKASLSALVKDLNDSLVALNESKNGHDLSRALDELQNSKDVQVTEFYSNLAAIAGIRAQAMEEIERLANDESKIPTPDEYVKLVPPYGEQAVELLWRVLLTQKLNSELSDLAVAVYDTIESKEAEITPAKMSDKLNELTGLGSAFENLGNKIKAQKNQNTQDSARMELVKEIGKLIPLPTGIQKNDSEARWANINSLIDTLVGIKSTGNATTIDKQSAIKALKDELSKVINADTQLVTITANLLCPSILEYETAIKNKLNCDIIDSTCSDEFYSKLTISLIENKEALLNEYKSAEFTADSFRSLVASMYNDFVSAFKFLANVSILFASETYTSTLKEWLAGKEDIDFEAGLLVEDNISQLKNLKTLVLTIKQLDYLDLVSLVNDFKDKALESDTETEKIILAADFDLNNYISSITDTESNEYFEEIKAILATLITNLYTLYSKAIEAEDGYENVINIPSIEKQLLDAIIQLDIDRDFYYTAPIDASLAIEFNESDASKNTLMNPTINYDVNNVNNNFVISKLDLNYLDNGNGIRIARSSRLN